MGLFEQAASLGSTTLYGFVKKFGMSKMALLMGVPARNCVRLPYVGSVSLLYVIFGGLLFASYQENLGASDIEHVGSLEVVQC